MHQTVHPGRFPGLNSVLKTGTAIAHLDGMMQPEPASILILDGDPFFARSVQILLEDEGRYEVAVGSAEHHALSGFATGKEADVLIVDSELLEQGSPLMRYVRQLEAGSIIVLTAHSVAPELIRIRQLDHAHVVQKPIDPEALLSLVRDMAGGAAEGASRAPTDAVQHSERR